MKRLSIFFAALLVSVGSIFAQEEVYKTALFGKDYNSKGVSSYSNSWSSTTNKFVVDIVNFNNNNNGWDYIKCGSKKNTSVATITTKAAIDKAITKVVVTLDKVTVANLNSTTLIVASDAAFTQDVQTITVTAAQGALPYVVTTPTKDMFYKLTYDCKKSSNGFVQISKIEYYASAAEIPATAIALDKETITLDKGATEQLTATLTPADATTAVVWTTENAEVATVEKGLVTAVGVGTTNIVATVTPAEGTTYTAKCAVTVVAAPDAPVFTVTDPVFEGTMNVAITAAEGMAIYYTTDGAEPTIESTKYEAPFAITATTTVKAIAYDATISKASVAAEMTYIKAMTCAEANAAADKAEIILNTVTVVYANGANIYVADATGTTLVHSYDLKDKLQAGQVVKGIKGSMKIFNGLPEIEPSVALADLTITEGTVPTPEVITAVPTMADINKYIKMEGVTMNAASFTSEGRQSVKGTFAETELTFYNTFKIDQEFEAAEYNIIGFVSAYKTMQIAVVSAEGIINWELNGGRVAAAVPTNAELWEAFKPYYNEFYSLKRADQPIDKVSTFAPAFMQKIMTDETSEYKWLGDYIYAQATEQGYTLSTDMANATESPWRWSAHAFFNCSPANSLAVKVAGFETAGKPEAWGAAYQAVHDAVLPTTVSEEYTLPTPTKMGATFLGWFDNEKCEGDALTTIPANYAGTLYASWKEVGTSVDDINANSATVEKIVRNGQVLIIRDGKTYNMMGQIVE